VLTQLFDNAVKFTQNGTIDLVAERMGSDAGDELVVHVIDTGIGIGSDQMSGLFEKFTVLDDSSTSKYGGTGLGLALSQKLCKLMGGEILVESELGRGSKFTVRLPLLSERRKGDTFASATLVPAASDFAVPSIVETTRA
jgi:signal transduction histidine kinase